MVDDEMKELKTYEDQAAAVIDEANRLALTVDSAASAEAAAQWCAAKLAWCDRIKKSYLGRVRDYFFQGHQGAIAEIDKYTVPIEGKTGRKGDTGGAVGIVKQAIVKWRAQEARRTADLQAKLYEEARKKDEADRLATAEKLEAMGNKPMADAVLAQAGNFVAPIIPQTKSKTQTGKMVWKVRIDPLKKGELLKMIADKQDLHVFVAIDEEKIRKQAVLMDGNLNWPGVTCYQEESLSINRKGF